MVVIWQLQLGECVLLVDFVLNCVYLNFFSGASGDVESSLGRFQLQEK